MSFVEELENINLVELAYRTVRASLPINVWIEFYRNFIIMNPKVDKTFATYLVTEVYDNVRSIFIGKNYFTKIFLYDLEARERFGRTWWINVFGAAGTGKSLWGLKLFMLFDDDAHHYKKLLPFQVSAESTILQENVSKYSKYHDVLTILARKGRIEYEKWFRDYRAWLESRSELSMKIGRRIIYYDGMTEGQLKELFEEAIDFMTLLGYVDKKGKEYVWTEKKVNPRKVFILDESLKKYGRGSLIMSHSLANMVKVSRTKNINYVFCGIEQFKQIPFDYILLSEEGLYDRYDYEKLRVLRAGVHYKVVYSGEMAYGRIGTAVVLSPPDDIIKEYLSVERNVSASGELGGLGMMDYTRMRIMDKFYTIQDTSSLVDVDEVIEKLEQDDRFKHLQDTNKLTWNRIKPIVEDIVKTHFGMVLTSSLWDKVRLEIEMRGLK